MARPGGQTGPADMTALAVAGCLVLAAVPLLGWPGGARARLAAIDAGGGRTRQQIRAVVAAVRAAFTRLLPTQQDAQVSLEFLATDVASLLRAGSSPAEAWWQGAQVRVDARGVPRLEALAARLGVQASALQVNGQNRRRQSALSRGIEQQAAGVVAGCVVAQQTGAPLAPVLESVARSVVLAEQGRTERDAALAGPRSTARILGWLPALGIILAFALGADPIGFLLGGLPGIATAFVGLGLMVLGRRWIKHLIVRAHRAGEVGGL